MPMPAARTNVLERLQESLKSGKIIVGAGAGEWRGVHEVVSQQSGDRQLTTPT